MMKQLESEMIIGLHLLPIVTRDWAFILQAFRKRHSFIGSPAALSGEYVCSAPSTAWGAFYHESKITQRIHKLIGSAWHRHAA